MTAAHWLRRELYTGTVDLPDWLVDKTGYQFKNPTDDEDLVSLEQLEPSADTVAVVAQRKLQNLLAVYDTAPVVTTPAACVLAHWPASCFTFQSPLLHGLVLSTAVIATPAGMTVLSVFDKLGQSGTFETAVSRLRANVPGSLPRDGFSRVPYRNFFLDLPSRLTAPTQFLYRGRGAEVRVQTKVGDRKTKRWWRSEPSS